MHFDWFLLMICYWTDARMTSSLKTFSLRFFEIAESFENLKDVSPDWVNEDIERKSGRGCGKITQKQEEGKK